ncbi:ThrRS/AlaRS common domain-containing protein [Vararia minispora EC-137]|uniref:ThrRS/AlaRS common domain-containing protein n=1 Tax=Vararia minispora EC-137 TaxID=1314806 RepID=A0ACB8QYY5_9AGAM|nr:ThrRS/AlaRS common domain-containing protein [Vararia minispora EC-137]
MATGIAAVVPPSSLNESFYPTTPSDYHRIVSPGLQIPSDPHVAIPVGILTCQRDPLARELDTVIVNSTFLRPEPPKGGSKKANQKQAKTSAAPTVSKPYLQITLHDTVLFPEGGGQSYDIGHLVTEDGSIWEIDFVKRHGIIAVHYAAIKDGLEGVPELLTAGKKVRVTLGEEGLKRRLDHMSMHTVAHLLASLLESKLDVPTLAWSLTSYPAPAYVDLPRALTPAEVTLIQDEANRLVFEGRRVHVEVRELDVGQAGAEGGDVPAARESRGLPSDYTGGVHRLVIIDGVDRNPCCGTHLPSLASLQLYILPPPAGGGTGPFRHLFLTGPRLLAHLNNVQTVLSRTAATMSCSVNETPDRVTLAVDENKRREKRIEDIERELAQTIGASLIEEMLRWRTEGGEGEWTRYIGRVDDEAGAHGFLQAITFAFKDLLPKDAPPYTLLLTSSPSSPTQTSTTVVMIFGSDDIRVKKVGEALKAQFKTLKGGGKGARWSGKATGVWLNERDGKMAALTLVQA